ncbi:hypothetical protein JK635_07565 [Neobacillus sp. YIM B02564]|uniref:Uncharacterized protein n=1 Tax=Neobacillus paridis TaxID=2803862 RepID=A0ABS1TL75_9BACI|nr:hypothetical protein [Neobacillus paridis]MBL4952066.1 hypothetical protein [Neobacillus paridis]
MELMFVRFDVAVGKEWIYFNEAVERKLALHRVGEISPGLVTYSLLVEPGNEACTSWIEELKKQFELRELVLTLQTKKEVIQENVPGIYALFMWPFALTRCITGGISFFLMSKRIPRLM